MRPQTVIVTMLLAGALAVPPAEAARARLVEGGDGDPTRVESRGAASETS